MQSTPAEDVFLVLRGSCIVRRMVTIYGLKTVFVATDDPNVIPSLQSIASNGSEPFTSVVFQDGPNRSAYSSKGDFIESRVSQKSPDGKFAIQKPILELLTDLEAGAR